jgi:hypothetical protein
MRTRAIWIAVIAVIAVGAFVMRDRLSGGAADLKAGDCFDDKAEAEIKDVQHHPCNEAHTAEVVLVANHPAAKGAAYPTDDELDSWSSTNCVPAVVNYVGTATALNTLAPAILYPKAEEWNNGERQMICYVVRSDGAPMTKSVKGGIS